MERGRNYLCSIKLKRVERVKISNLTMPAED
jgi:hypothetical protein